MRITGRDEAAKYTDIQVNGVSVPFCLWVDTDEGVAECLFAVNGRPLITLDYSMKFRDGDIEYYDSRAHSYSLHNFTVVDKRTNTVVAEVR